MSLVVFTLLLAGVLLSPRTGIPPSFETSHREEAEVFVGTPYQFSITATDADGDLVSLQWLNPLPGDVEVVPSGDGARRTLSITWAVSGTGAYQLLFQARDAGGSSTIAKLHLRSSGWAEATPCVLADVTGDGKVDLVAGSTVAFDGDGAVFVWETSKGQEGDPDYILQAPGTYLLGYFNFAAQRIQCADVTGDGIADILVASDYGGSRIDVWIGGSLPHQTGPIPPNATLRPPAAAGTLFRPGELGVACLDLTGDGIRDVLTATRGPNAYGTAGAGAVYLWAGQLGGWSGDVGPTAIFSVPTAATGDSLGMAGQDYDSLPVRKGIRFLDVTGDQRLDLVASAPFADVAGKLNVGAAYVWSGAGPMTGVVPPSATLFVPQAFEGDLLGYCHPAELYCHDVTGDSLPDIVLGAVSADTPTGTNVGVIYVWEGGSSLDGTPRYRARLHNPLGFASDHLAEEGMWFGEVTGDGVTDVLARAPHADVAGEIDRGAYYVFSGGASLLGETSPTATLSLPGYKAEPSRLTVGDVGGDGVGDVIVAYRYVGSSEGEVHVMQGGPSLTGMPLPDAMLSLGIPGSGNDMGLQGLACRDFDGDGILDIFAASGSIRVNGVYGVGGVVTFSGGPGLFDGTGSRALLTVQGGKQGDSWVLLAEFLMQDVTGDGVRDLIANPSGSYFGGVAHAGSYLVWAGGSQPDGVVAPTARIGAKNPQDEFIGSYGSLIFDVTRDGIPDILSASPRRDVNGHLDAGVLYFWRGGATLEGIVTPSETLLGYGISPKDWLGEIGGSSGMRVGALVAASPRYDILAGCSYKNLFGRRDVGAINVWVGGPGNLGRKRYSVSSADEKCRLPWSDN